MPEFTPETLENLYPQKGLGLLEIVDLNKRMNYSEEELVDIEEV